MQLNLSGKRIEPFSYFYSPELPVFRQLFCFRGIIFLGDVQRLAAVTEKIVPVMAALFILGALVIIAVRIKYIPETIGLIFKYAFQPQAILGGAFGVVFGERFGAIFVAVCLFFFAFSTVLSWNLFGKINANYLFGRKNPKTSTIIYSVIAIIFIFVGTIASNDLVWELTDMFNNLMVIPNVIALFALTRIVIGCVKEGKEKRRLKSR